MTSIERTAHPRFKRLITAHELHLVFAPSARHAGHVAEPGRRVPLDRRAATPLPRHGRIAHPMHRNGKQIGDPTGRITAEGIGDAITRAATRAHLTAPTELLPDLPPRWSGHSRRRGFATAAKQAGKDLIETARHGGWVDGSKSLAGYFEQAGMWDETNPLYGIRAEPSAYCAGRGSGPSRSPGAGSACRR